MSSNGASSSPLPTPYKYRDMKDVMLLILWIEKTKPRSLKESSTQEPLSDLQTKRPDQIDGPNASTKFCRSLCSSSSSDSDLSGLRPLFEDVRTGAGTPWECRLKT